jgi:predicted phage-related endonuclease
MRYLYLNAKVWQVERDTMSTQEVSAKVELDAVAIQALAQFRIAKEAEAAAKASKKQAEKILREALGSALVGTANGFDVIVVKDGVNTSFDRKVMLEIAPEVYNLTLRRTEYTFLDTV